MPADLWWEGHGRPGRAVEKGAMLWLSKGYLAQLQSLDKYFIIKLVTIVGKCA